MASSSKVLSTKMVKMVNYEAVGLGLNRAITDEAIDALDPDGLHLLTETYCLDDGATYRHHIMLKIRLIDDPVEVFIDTVPDSQAHLIVKNAPLAEDLMAQLGD
jgi:hypothetical protein